MATTSIQTPPAIVLNGEINERTMAVPGSSAEASSGVTDNVDESQEKGRRTLQMWTVLLTPRNYSAETYSKTWGPFQKLLSPFKKRTTELILPQHQTTDQISQRSKLLHMLSLSIVRTQISIVESNPRGFPSLASLMSADPALAMCRMYNFLRNRLILEKQVELAKLQERLAEQDATIAKDDPKSLATLEREPRSDERRTQISLMGDIHAKLKDYGPVESPVPRQSAYDYKMT